MAEITKDTGFSGNSIGNIAWFSFIAVALFTYFFGLDIPLLGPDEPRYAQVAREMYERGDWITPTLGGLPWFEKPALLYWLEIVSYKVFGVSEFAARFGPAIFGILTVASLWILGVYLQRSKFKDQSSTFCLARWLVIISASTLGLIAFARGASFDVILTFPITASLVGFFLADIAEKKNFRSYYLPLFAFYFFIGVALLAKGLVGIVFPFAIVGFYFLLSWHFPSKEFIVSLFWGTLVWLAVACVWYVPVYQVNGYRFIDEFFIQHHFQRYTSNKYQHPQPFYFFFWVLPLMTLPWLPFFLAAIWDLGRNLFSRKEAKTQRTELTASPRPRVGLLFSSSPLLLFSTAWLLVPLVFFSFSGSKLPGYILPSLPPAIILAAEFISRFAYSRPKWRAVIIATAFATLIGVCVFSQFAVARFAYDETVKDLIAAAPSNDKIYCLHTVSHNAEFYAAGRLLRNADGTQRRFDRVQDIVDEMKTEGTNEALVLMPIAYIKEMPIYEQIKATPIKDNGELAIVKFELK